MYYNNTVAGTEGVFEAFNKPSLLFNMFIFFIRIVRLTLYKTNGQIYLSADTTPPPPHPPQNGDILYWQNQPPAA